MAAIEELPDWERLLAAERVDGDHVLSDLRERWREMPDGGRGELSDWRELYRLAHADAQLRARIRRLVLTVPLPLPHFWLAALAGLGDPVDFDAPVPDYYDATAI